MKFFVLLLSAFSVVLVSSGNAASSADEFVQACIAGDLASVRQHLAKGAKVSAADSEGRIPLLAALFSRNAEMVSLLLQRGADPNQVGQCPEKRCTGHPALVLAAYLNEPKLVKLLLDARADIGWDDHLATRKANIERHVEVFKILRDAGGREWKSPDKKQPSAEQGKSTVRALPFGVTELLPGSVARGSKPSGDKLRLAIIADDSTRTAADVLATELNGSFALVERNELDRVLDEQKLSRQFTDDAFKAQQVGALLGADAIVLMRKVELGAESLLELRFVRVSPGLILDTNYKSWPLQNVANWAMDAAARLDSMSAKVRGKNAIALSPADFRPATNSPAAVSLARQAALLVADRMVRQPGVVVLERAALSDLARERTLSSSGAFWAGSYLVDGTAEASLDGKGTGVLTLRLQPVDGRAPLAFTARGAIAQLGGLVDELISQAVKSFALQPSQAMDSAAEAERYFAESRAAFQRSLFLTAYRAAETAALLGLRSPEFTEWRLKAALSVVSWQAGKLASSGSFEGVRGAGWGEAWINERMEGSDWLRIPEWLDLARQTVELWREVLCMALESGDLEKVQTAFDYQRDVIGNFAGIWHSVNLSATIVERSDQLAALPYVLRKTFEDALAIVERRPGLGSAQAILSRLLARDAGVAYPWNW